jgi:hypothetical protein
MSEKRQLDYAEREHEQPQKEMRHSIDLSFVARSSIIIIAMVSL